MRTVIFLALAVVSLAAPARAQFVVSDPENLAQAVLIADRTLQEYNTLMEQYRTIVRMSQGLGALDRYRMPAIGFNGPDTTNRPTALRGSKASTSAIRTGTSITRQRARWRSRARSSIPYPHRLAAQ